MRVLVFGASGAIGTALSENFKKNNWDVVAVSRTASGNLDCASKEIVYHPFTGKDEDCLDPYAPYAAVCWAQGRNATDNVFTVDIDENLAVYQANCLYVISTLKILLNRKLLAKAARLCIISSIWQNLARQDKLSYCMSKSALQGLVLSASVDLGQKGILINAILPGALDTPMTQTNLTAQQLNALRTSTYFNKLPSLDDVANLALFLCSSQNTGITGQFIAADLGFSHAKLL